MNTSIDGDSPPVSLDPKEEVCDGIAVKNDTRPYDRVGPEKFRRGPILYRQRRRVSLKIYRKWRCELVTDLVTAGRLHDLRIHARIYVSTHLRIYASTLFRRSPGARADLRRLSDQYRARCSVGTLRYHVRTSGPTAPVESRGVTRPAGGHRHRTLRWRFRDQP